MTTFNPLFPFEKVPVLERMVYGNTLGHWVVVVSAAVVLPFVLVFLKTHLLHWIRQKSAQTQALWDDDAAHVISQTRTFVLVGLTFTLLAQTLSLPKALQRGFEIAALVLVFLQLFFWLDSAAKILLRRTLHTEIASHGSLASPKAVILSFLLRAALSALVLLLFLDNLGVNITALVTGLGIGGIAVALAVQNILGDLFASASIALDKPFEVDDFIVVGEVSGNVEKVGLKTTRIRSLSGEQIIFPNADLLQSRVRNFKRMTQRRVQFRFGIEYATPPEKIDLAQSLVKDILLSTEKTRFDRVHFVQLAESALEFEVVYWVLSSEFIVFADVHHSVLKRMLEAFAENNLTFAFPTRTVMVARQP